MKKFFLRRIKLMIGIWLVMLVLFGSGCLGKEAKVDILKGGRVYKNEREVLTSIFAFDENGLLDGALALFESLKNSQFIDGKEILIWKGEGVSDEEISQIFEISKTKFEKIKIIENFKIEEINKWMEKIKVEIDEGQAVLVLVSKIKFSEDLRVTGIMKKYINKLLGGEFEINPKYDLLSAEKEIQVLMKLNAVLRSQKLMPLIWENGKFFVGNFVEGLPIKGFPTTFLFTGDIMLGRHVDTLMKRYGENYPFEKLDEVLLKANDFLVGNLEGPITDKAIKTTKSIAFRFQPKVVEVLKKYSFDALSIANNHTYDMGVQGELKTRELLEKAGIIWFGDAKKLDEEKVWKFSDQERQFAVLGLNHTDFKLDLKNTYELIRKLKDEGFTVIVYIHWGIEYVRKPSAWLKNLAREFIDNGVDLIIGTHPHVVQSVEVYRDKPIFYSLGNMVFDQYFSRETQEGLLLGLEFTGKNLVVKLFPIKLERAAPKLMNEKEKQLFLNEMAGFSELSPEREIELKNGEMEFIFN